MKTIDPRTAKTKARGRLLPFNQCTIGVAREYVTPGEGTEATFDDAPPPLAPKRSTRGA